MAFLEGAEWSGVAVARTQVRRIPERGTQDRAVLDAILDEGIVCHVGLVESGVPFVIPTGYVRDGDRLLLHGSRASRLLKALASGSEVCITVTLLDGIVLARSAFHHSMNYRSAVLFGHARPLEGDAAWDALKAYMDRLVPGRWDEARQPNPKEMAGTLVVEFPIAEASAKVRAGPPKDEPEDMAFPAWSGIVPLRTTVGAPEQDPTQATRTPPPHVTAWRPERRNG
jgi:hypothetical protein